MPTSKATTKETAKPRGVKKKLGEVGTTKGKATIASKKKRTSDPQLRRQQAAIKAIKASYTSLMPSIVGMPYILKAPTLHQFLKQRGGLWSPEPIA